ncbi:bifunctional serine/threonine-protein kinase/formylglycine-generating enzyme family protein [Gimesia sp.]|uniref:bifunctional serine/threonine-protein kinase/formylglycine-generating enzyme family protein n=1 Tax=Gimesia sp. TaxID=2024833 RepID=UPI003A94E4D5
MAEHNSRENEGDTSDSSKKKNKIAMSSIFEYGRDPTHINQAHDFETTLSDDEDWRFLKGEIIDKRYEIKKPIGRGGMGEVYAVYDQKENDLCAIKVIRTSLQGKRAIQERFINEGRFRSLNSPPNIVNIYETAFSTSQNIHYIIMELIDWPSLSQLLKAGQSFSPHEALEIGKQICEAIVFLHNREIIHRDIKPDNILIRQNRGNISVKLTDFGIAKHPNGMQTIPDIGFGATDYAAPEQLISAATVTGQADIYSLGIVLSEMLTGHLRVRSSDQFSRLIGSLPTEVKKLISDAIAERPQDRIRDAGTMLARINTLFNDLNSDNETTTSSSKELPSQFILPTIVIVATLAVFVFIVALLIKNDFFLRKVEHSHKLVFPDGRSKKGYSFNNYKKSQKLWAQHVNERIKITNSIGMAFRLVPPGEYIMGSSGKSIYENQHQVCITKPFYLAETEVTQEQWQNLMGTTPWRGQRNIVEGREFPATFVSWFDTQDFIARLNNKEGKEYRLPTEAEWEYVCRSGNVGMYGFDNGESPAIEYAWFKGNAYLRDEKYAHSVGQLEANPWGFYDMHGNVWEWCQDWYGRYDDNSTEGTANPIGPESGLSRVCRGGCWNNSIIYCRSSTRNYLNPNTRRDDVGFRLVLTVESEQNK